MNDSTSIVYIVLLIAAGLFALVIAPKFDRDRIRENIEEHGGKIIEIVRVWEWTRHYGRCYDVSYETARDKRVYATCRTNMWRGVYWVHDRPPGLCSSERVPADFSIDYDARAASIATEPIQCLGCGATISAGKASCPKCGWSYQVQQAGK